MQNTGYNQAKKNCINITIHKITERIESNTILEDADDEGSIKLLISIKYKMIVEETGSPI